VAQVEKAEFSSLLKRIGAAGSKAVEKYEELAEAERAARTPPAREILEEGLGHAYLTYTLDETFEEGESLDVPGIMTRLQDLSAEVRYLQELKFSDYPPHARENRKKLQEAKRELKEVRRGFRPRVWALIEIGVRKQQTAAVSDEEAERLIAQLHEEAERILEREVV
jgi:hypothetical protein